MALVCVFLRKANYFQHVLKSDQENACMPTPNIGFSKAMSGFIMMMTQQGKLLYISENAAEYLGHSMEDLLIHGDSVYDVVDKQDHMVVQNQLACRSSSNNGGGIAGTGGPAGDERRLFLCRINVSRNSRRQLRFGDQKVVLVEGHYLPFVPLCNRNESVFLASCTPVVLPETRESVVQGATNIFTTIHSMDMKYLHIDKTAESHMEYSRSELVGVSWYNLLHWDSIRTAYCKHQTVIQSDQERSSTALLRLQSRSGRWFWIHCVLQVKDTSEECQHPIIVCTNQVLSEKEAEILRASSWLYQYSSQSKFTYGVCPSLPASAAPQSAQHEALLQGYVPPDSEYSNGRLSAASLPYGIPAPPPPTSGHLELDFGVSNATPTTVPYIPPSHTLEEGQLAPWSSGKDRMLVKQEPAEVYGCGDSSAEAAQRSASIRASAQQSAHHAHQETVDTVAEPVDMSINNNAPPTEHDANSERHSAQQHCLNNTGAAAEFCHCSEAHLPATQHNNNNNNNNNNKSPDEQMPVGMAYQRIGSGSSSSSSNCSKPPPLDSTHHYLGSNDHQQPELSPHKQLSPGLVHSPDNNGTHKYSIVDLDKLGHTDVTTASDPYASVQPPHKRQLLLLHQQQQQSKAPSPHEILPDVAAHHQISLHHMEPEHQQQQWTSPAGPTALWSDCGLQRVPDVVQQDLSPYITTPTTPAETPDADSSEHHTPETPSTTVFNFDWPGEQHVPNLRLLSFRSSSYSPHTQHHHQHQLHHQHHQHHHQQQNHHLHQHQQQLYHEQHPNQHHGYHVDGSTRQPIALQLPRKKSLHHVHHVESSLAHRDGGYAK